MTTEEKKNLITQVATYLGAFAQQEMGNRLSEFAMVGLRDAIMKELQAIKVPDEKPEEDGQPKGPQKLPNPMS